MNRLYSSIQFKLANVNVYIKSDYKMRQRCMYYIYAAVFSDIRVSHHLLIGEINVSHVFLTRFSEVNRLYKAVLWFKSICIYITRNSGPKGSPNLTYLL